MSTVEAAVPIEPPVAKLLRDSAVSRVAPLFISTPPLAVVLTVRVLVVVSAFNKSVPVEFWIWKAVVELVFILLLPLARFRLPAMLVFPATFIVSGLVRLKIWRVLEPFTT